MRIEKQTSGDVVLLKVSGTISFTDTNTLKSLLHRVAHEGQQKIIVDCQEMDSINSQALAVFLSAYKALKGGIIVFANANPHVQRVLKSTHLDDMFPLYGTVEAAVNAMKPV